MNRREFLASGLFTATAGLAVDGCAPDTSGLIPILIPEEPFIPGEESWHASTCFECASGCGTLVRKIDGRLVKVEGNPSHPVSRGGLCARGQAVPQAMYHPDRFRGPLLLQGSRGSGDYRESSWEEALEHVASAVSASGGAPGFVTGAVTGHRLHMVRRFLAALGGGTHLIHDPFTNETTSRVEAQLTGIANGFHASIDRAGYVLSVGAELLESHVSPVRFGRGLSEMRRGTPGRRGKLVAATPRLSLTAAKADAWIPVQPGDELSLVLGLTSVILEEALYDREAAGLDGAGLEAFRGLLASSLDPDALAARVSWPRGRIEQVARELASNRPSLVIAGGAALRSADGLALATAVSHLNALLGAYGEGGLLEPNADALERFAPWPSIPTDGVTTRAFAGSDLPAVLFVSGANPAYDLPPDFGLEESLSEIDRIVSFGSFPDETSRFADVILPESMAFERFEDELPPSGSSVVANLSSPLLARPLYDTRSMPDALMAIARQMGLGEAFPWDSYEQALQEAWSGLGTSWSEAVASGGYWEESAAPASRPMRYRFEAEAIASAIGSRQTEAEELRLHIYAANALGDGRSAHLPFLQELADPVTGVRWGSVVEIGAATAASLRIAHGDRVEVRSGERTVTARAHVSPGVHPRVVAIAAGQGHSAYGRYAEGRGVNAFTLLGAASDEHGFLMTAPVVTLRKAEG